MSSRISDEEISKAWDVGLKSKDGTTALERIAEAQRKHSDQEWAEWIKEHIRFFQMGDDLMPPKTAADRGTGQKASYVLIQATEIEAKLKEIE